MIGSLDWQVFRIIRHHNALHLMRGYQIVICLEGLNEGVNPQAMEIRQPLLRQ